MIARILLASLCLQSACSYRTNIGKIPNGANVPFPCKPGTKWEGVGHFNDKGTGFRNPFGRDFEAAGSTWTEALCRKDSDGDGRSNGLELGDPDCLWKENAVPKMASDLSHPGICDPWDSPKCMEMTMTSTKQDESKYKTQKEWMDEECKTSGFDCPAINEKGIKQLPLRLPVSTSIPPRETTYVCQIFDLSAQGMPAGKDFHIVAVTPLIDQTDVVHHMTVSSCAEGTEPTPEPFQCGMVASPNCQNYIHTWTVGLDGECYHPLSGIRIGLTGVKVVSIQVHWNNPTKRSDFTDSSGVLLHYTPNLRANDAGVIVIGNMHFAIPPKRPEFIVVSNCSSSCTKQIMKGPVHVTWATNHMHYAGNKMHVKVMRNNTFLQYLTNDLVYSYDSPQVQLYPTPLQLLPGDALIGSCGYNSTDRNRTTFFGAATSDEMCLAFVTYFPRQNIDQHHCVDRMGVSACNPSSFEGCTNFEAFTYSVSTTSVYREVSQMCRRHSPCLDECRDTIVKFMKTEKCMQGNIWNFIQELMAETNNEQGNMFLSYLASCKVEVHMAMTSSPTEQPNTTTTGKCSSGTTTIGSIFILAVTMVTTLLLKK